jgi:hypothetical protein
MGVSTLDDILELSNERPAKHITKTIGTDARNCEIPKVHSHSNDFSRNRLWSILLESEL